MWGKRRKRSPKASYDDYEYYSDHDNDIYALLALSDDKSNEENDGEMDNSDDVNDKFGKEELDSYYDDIDIDIETTAMAVNKMLDIDEDLPNKLHPNDGSMNVKQ